MNATVTTLLIYVLVLSISTLSSPQAAKAQQPPPPPVEPISAADLDYATRVALAQGVMLLKQYAEKDPQGWIIPPIQKVRITGYKDVPRKYRLIEYDRPIYEYTDVVVFIPGPSPGDPPIRQVRKQPTKQIGTRKESHIRWDPEGPLEMIDKQPIYEHVGDTSWQGNLVGDSAMALSGLRAAGLPEGDPVVQRMVDNLFAYLDTYGMPDQTWNVAWLTMVMARTDGALAAEWTEKLASRLLDGQITDGAARGLWGPMCLHPRLLSVLVRDYLAAEAELAKRVAKHKEQPTKAKKALVDEAEGVRNRLKKYSDTWSRYALRFATVEFPLVWDDQLSEKVHFLGSTEFFYNQRSADMESTWAALRALAVCAEEKRLPKESLRTSIQPTYSSTPKIGATVKPTTIAVVSELNAKTVPPEAAMAVLARAANALAALQPEGGGWSECNFHQPVTDFDAFGKFLSVPADPASFPPLASPVTAMSAAEGISALDSIGRAVGMDKLAKFQPNFTAGAKGRTATQLELIKTAWPKPTLRPAALRPDMYQLFLVAAHALQIVVPEDTASQTAAEQLTHLLLLTADPDGGWGSRYRRSFIPSSSRERYATLKDLPGQNWKGWYLNVPVELQKAHVSLWNVTPTEYNTSPGASFATAAAVHYLASRLKDPGATLLQLCSDPALAETRKEVDTLLVNALKPKPAPVVAAKPAIKPTAAAKPAVKPVEEAIPAISIKPADTKPKKDESF